jgi:uncharacterized surface protein with fasciclin (FAS1) repeats
VQTTIEQLPGSGEETLASVLLAMQPAHSSLNRHVRTQVVPNIVRTSLVNMQTKESTAMKEGVVHFSWSDIGSGDIATQLGKLTGPCVQQMDLATRTMKEFNDNFDKFIAAAQSQGTMELLKGSGPFTLLVPVDSSISKNVDTKAHILNGKFSLEDLAAGGSAQTLAGTTVEYRKALKLVKVEDASVKAVFNPADHRGGKLSTAFPFDVECTNGVIHAIDEPLVETNEPLPAQTPASAPAQAPPAPYPSAGSATGDYLASLGAQAPPAPAPASGMMGGYPTRQSKGTSFGLR